MKQKSYKERSFSNPLRRMAALFIGLLIFTAVYGQEKTITGTVTDKTGATLPGVNVVVKGTSIGTVTDLNGKYTIKVPGPDAVVTFTYVGYQSQEIKVGDQTTINPVLEEEVTELDQVVVIGYGVQKKSDLTGSVASVSGGSFQGVAVNNLVQALQGRAAGVNVVSNTGMPGGSVTVQIRGMSSVNGGNPLVVIDGIPGGDLNSLNPADIESVEILKDAASQAIYGSNGGNGVIIVTTKKGKAGKFQTTLNASYGWQNVARKVPMMGLEDYNRTLAEIGYAYFKNIDTLQYNDYNNIIFEENVPVQNYDFSTGGGTEKSNFYISGSYFGQDGIIRKSNYEKTNFRIKSEHKATERIKFDQNVSFINTRTEGFEEWMYTNVYFTPIFPALQMPPYLTPYDENGKWMMTPGGIHSPFVDIDILNRWSKSTTTSGNAGLTIDLIKGLTYSPRINGYVGISDNQNFVPKYNYKGDQNNERSRLEKRMQRSYGWLVQNVVNYNTKINEHNIGLMAGHEAQRNWGYDISGSRLEFKSTLPNLLYLSMSRDDTTNSQTVEGGGWESRMLSYFGRVTYDYKSMFLLQANIRRDGYTHFGPNYRYGVFKSGSAGFKFSELDAVKNLGFLSFGKVRVSYGETGQYGRSNWPYLAKIQTPGNVYNYAFDNNASSTGAGPVQIPNPDLHWETVISTTVGLDLGFLRDKLMVSLDYFTKKNDGMINFKDVPFYVGTYQTNSGAEGGPTQPEVNAGSVENKGLELSLTYKENIGDLKATFDLSFTYVKNKITDLATDSVVKGSVHNELTGITIQKEGQPISTFWGRQVESIIKKDDPKAYYAKAKKDVYFQVNSKGDTIYLVTAKPGDVRWKDNNNDGRIDDKDRTYLGNPNPPYIFSFSVYLNYKIFDFSALFNGVYGNKIFNGAGRYFYNWNTVPANRSARFADRYRDPLTDKQGNLILYDNGTPIDPGNEKYDLPRLGQQNYAYSSELYIEDGSYLRLKNIQLGVTLPSSISKSLKIEKFRIYASVTNVFIWTKYTGFDPEVGRYDFSDPTLLGIDIGGYPKTRVFTLGANLTF